jgi:hypothetical protein
MALTRKLLKGMGLTEEQMDTIIEAHTDTVDGLKSDLARYKADAEKLPGVQAELENLKAKGDDGWKDILENAIDTISALKQAEIETALEEIETLIKQAEMEQAEASCLELLESGNLSAEQEQMANDYLNDIALMCFAGTYIVLPDYITGRDAERVTGATVEKILNGGQAFVDFYYKREGDFKVAKDYYLSYLNSRLRPFQVLCKR